MFRDVLFLHPQENMVVWYQCLQWSTCSQSNIAPLKERKERQDGSVNCLGSEGYHITLTKSTKPEQAVISGPMR